MKFPKVLAIIIAALAALSFAFQDSQVDEDQAIALEVREKMAGYQQWQIIPGTTEKMPGQSPHGKYVTLYANAIARDSLAGDESSMAEGSILVKDNFNSREKLESVSVMYRMLTGWKWMVYEPDGAIREAGRLKNCIDCHAGAEHDGVFSWNPAQ